MPLAETVFLSSKEDSKTLKGTDPEHLATLGKANQPEPREKAYKGLCVDCRNRLSCVLSHTPGGVWNCNEYA